MCFVCSDCFVVCCVLCRCVVLCLLLLGLCCLWFSLLSVGWLGVCVVSFVL